MRKKVPTEQEAKWLELIDWIERNIFNYDTPRQVLHKEACLILKGLQRGQIIANNNIKHSVEYPAEVLLIAFKINKIKILNAIKNKKFECEHDKMLYICSIVRNDLEDVNKRYLNKK